MNSANELKKLEIHNLNNLVEYVPNEIISCSVIKKMTGHVIISSLDKGAKIPDTVSPFDNYIHIIDGTAEIIINEKKFNLPSGDSIIISANARYCLNAKEKFKMLSVLIKSGYEDI